MLSLFALPAQGSPPRFAVRAGPEVARVRLRHAPDGEEELLDLDRVPGGFAKTLALPTTRYRFLVDLSDGRRVALNAAGVQEHEPLDAFDFTLRPLGPAWARSAVFYQVFPDRFAQGDPGLAVRDNEYRHRGHPARKLPWEAPPEPYSRMRCLDFRGGDLVGLRQRLDHVQALGCDALYLTPIHPAFTNHRYDVCDLGAVDPHLGGEPALQALCDDAHGRGMRLVLDAVINHVGSGHRWFNREGRYPEPGAYQDPRSPWAEFFFFQSRNPTRYLAWKGIDTLPRLDYRSRKLRAALWGPGGDLRKWLEPPFRVDGYRFDCANMVGRAGEVQLAAEVWRELAAALSPLGQPYLVGEHWFDPGDAVGPGLLHGGMDYLGFTFPVRRFFSGVDRDGGRAPISGQALLRQLMDTHAASAGAAHLNCVDSHDVSRLRTAAGREAFLAASALQLFWPGAPCVYYGSEVGLEGGDDPDNRRSMVWDRARWDEGCLAALREGIARRRASPALREGQLAPLGAGEDWAAFARVHPQEVAVAVLGRGAAEVTLDLRALGGGELRHRFSGPGCRVEAWALSPGPSPVGEGRGARTR